MIILEKNARKRKSQRKRCGKDHHHLHLHPHPHLHLHPHPHPHPHPHHTTTTIPLLDERRVTMTATSFRWCETESDALTIWRRGRGKRLELVWPTGWAREEDGSSPSWKQIKNKRKRRKKKRRNERMLMGKKKQTKRIVIAESRSPPSSDHHSGALCFPSLGPGRHHHHPESNSKRESARTFHFHSVSLWWRNYWRWRARIRRWWLDHQDGETEWHLWYKQYDNFDECEQAPQDHG